MPAKTAPRRRGLLVVLSLATALVLAGCGAQVNSEMVIEDDFSGHRTLVAGISQRDMDSIDGGSEALRALLESETPDELVFDSLEESDDEDGWEVQFTLNFSDPEDYEDKVESLIDEADDYDGDDDVSFEAESSELRNGISISESFPTHILLGWVAEALIDEEMVPGSYSLGTLLDGTSENRITVGGETYDTEGGASSLEFSRITDNRFDGVQLQFGVDQSGAVEIQADYPLGSSEVNAAGVQSSPEQQREYVQSISEDVTALDDVDAIEAESSNDVAETIAVRANGDDAVNAAVQALLKNSSTQVHLDQSIAEDGSADFITSMSGQALSCETFCTDNASIAVQVNWPEEWESYSATNFNVDDGGEFTSEARHGLPLESVRSTLRLETGDAVSQTFEFSVDTALLAGEMESVDDKFSPGELGELTRGESDGILTYTVEIPAENPEELNEKLATYFGIDSAVDWVNRGEASGTVLKTSTLTGSTASLWDFATGGVSGDSEFRVELPNLYSPALTEVENPDSENKPVNVESIDGAIVIQDADTGWVAAVKGPSMPMLITLGVIALVVIALIVLALIFRRQIKQLFTGAHPEQGAPAYSTGEFAPPASPAPGPASSPNTPSDTRAMPGATQAITDTAPGEPEESDHQRTNVMPPIIPPPPQPPSSATEEKTKDDEDRSRDSE